MRKLLRATSDRGRERYRRAGLTATASLFQKALTVTISLVSVPLTIHYLGPEQYGVWLTISSLLVWMALTDFGLAGNALINVLSEAAGRDDQRSAQENVSSALWTLTGIAALFALIAVVTFHWISWSAVFRVTSVPRHELDSACALTLAFFILGLPLSVQHSIYSAYQDGFMSSLCSIIMNLAALTALVIVTRFHGGIAQLVLALSGTRTAVALINVYYMFFVRYPWLKPRPSAVRWHCIVRLFRLGSKYLVNQIGAFGIAQSQPMIITQMLGPAKVVAFVVAQRVMTLPMDVIYMSTAPLVPAFGEARARDDWGWIRRAYRKISILTMVVGVPILVAIAFAARPLIRFWAGPAAVPDINLVLWLALFNAIGVALMVTGQLLIGLERINALTLSVVICACTTIGFGILGCRWIGLDGVAMAMAMAKLMTFWPLQIWAARRVFVREPARALPIATQSAA
ncbi:MAG TPA: oligosaccharide flippase family protein [Acidobacteriaceae bacterium]|nr:oligosaccharide flippase family protein [Acidobacteriaceae bacterium]